MEDSWRKMRPWVLTGILVVLGVIGGATLGWDPFGTGQGPYIRVEGLAAWLQKEEQKREEFERQAEAARQEAENKAVTRAREQKTKTRSRKSTASVEKCPRDITLNTAHILAGRHDGVEATGSFADIGMPGLTPGSEITVSLNVPSVAGAAGAYIDFGPRVVGRCGVFHAKLPRYLQTENGSWVDLSQRMYEFYVKTNERRFANCSSRFARLTVGRDFFWFYPAERAFCGANDPLPDWDVLPTERTFYETLEDAFEKER